MFISFDGPKAPTDPLLITINLSYSYALSIWTNDEKYSTTFIQELAASSYVISTKKLKLSMTRCNLVGQLQIC